MASISASDGPAKSLQFSECLNVSNISSVARLDPLENFLSLLGDELWEDVVAFANLESSIVLFNCKKKMTAERLF